MKLFFTAIFCVFVGSVFAQITFKNHYGELDKSDYGEKIIQLPNGDYITCGGQVFKDTIQDEFVGFGVIRRIKETGEELWSKNFSDTSSTKQDLYFSDIIFSSDSNLIITGVSNHGYFNSYYDFFLTKMDVDGNVIFNKNYTTPYRQWAKKVIETSDGGYLLAGYNEFDGSANSISMYAVKTDSLGVVEWEYIQPDNNPDSQAIRHQVYSIIETKQGDFILGGSINQILHQSTDFYAVKISAGGEFMWGKIIDHAIAGEVRAVFIKQNRNILLCGWYAPNMCAVPMIIELDPDGQFLGEYEFNASFTCEWAYSFSMDNNDNVTMLSFTAENKYRITKIDPQFNTEWNHFVTYDGGSSVEANGITQTVDGGYVCSGTSLIHNNAQAVVFKTDKNGLLVTRELGYPETNLEIFPNPVQDVLNIQLEGKGQVESIQIFDAIGKLVMVSRSLKVDVTGLVKGAYTLKVKWDKQVISKKFVMK